MRYFILVLFSLSLLQAEVIPTQDMVDDGMSSTVEFQYFIIKTREVDTHGLTPKVVFEGELDDYYEFYKPLMKTNTELMLKANVAEICLQSLNGAVSNSISSGAGGSDPMGMIATMGIGVAINQAAAMFDTDDIFLKVTDYFDKNGKGVTRITKMIISEDDLDDEEVISVYKSSHDTSYHYHTALISKIYED